MQGSLAVQSVCAALLLMLGVVLVASGAYGSGSAALLVAALWGWHIDRRV